MDFHEPVDDSDDDLPQSDEANTGLNLFEAGDWPAAIPVLQSLSDPSPAAAACLLIYQTLTGARGEATADDLSDQADVAVCRAWMEIRDAADHDRLAALAHACLDATWFPVWTLVIRTLTDFDQRHALRDLIDAAGTPTDPGQQLALAEARLECGLPVDDVHTIEVENCPPLPLSVSQLWQRWLGAEFDCWQGTVYPVQLDDLEPPVGELYAQQQWDFLMHKAALFNARIAPQAFEHWIEVAAQHGDTWENEYIRGLHAWANGDLRAAADHLDHSRERNRAQSRVAFEWGVLRQIQGRPGMPRPVPGVPDMVACAAVAQYRAGRHQAAADLLAQLDLPAEPFALRLISARAVHQRIDQGRALWAQLAELDHDWLAAIDRWQRARAAEPGAERNLAYRAHRLYLLGRHVAEVGKTADRQNYAAFQRELGLLTVRTLTGDAMFYRGMAAVDYKPDRALADWRALLRQRAWLAHIHLAPTRLICLGDRLLAAGVATDAAKAYLRAADLLPSSAALMARIATAQPTALRTLDLNDLPDSARWDWLYLLAHLSEAPIDQAAVDNLLASGRLPPAWQAVGTALAEIALDHAAAQRVLQSITPYLADLPESLRTGIEALAYPLDMDTLRQFKTVFGAAFQQWLPYTPESLLAAQIRQTATDPAMDVTLVAQMLHQFATMDIVIADGWRALVNSLQAIQAAAAGDRDTAWMLYQQTQQMLNQGNSDDI